MNLPEHHAKALADTGRIVDGIKDGQWHDPTPSSEWDVRTLLNHIVGGNWWVRPLVEGKTIPEVGDRFDGDLLGHDPKSAYTLSAEDAAAAFRSPGAMAAPCAVSYGPVPGEIYAGHRFIDVLIHGWDLVKATGQDTWLDPELVQVCWDVVEPQVELLKGSGMFGTEPELPADADLQTQLLARLGRQA